MKKLIIASLLSVALLGPVAANVLFPKIKSVSENVNAFTGDTVKLACVTDYHPQALVMWYKVEGGDISFEHANNIYKSERFDLTSKRGDFKNEITYVLKINDIEDADAGQYRCHILFVPEFGNINVQSRDVHVDVRPPPVYGLFGLGRYDKVVIISMMVLGTLLFSIALGLTFRFIIFIFTVVSKFFCTLIK